MHRKAHPDEKGTESWKGSPPSKMFLPYRKAHPDEKGTERSMAAPRVFVVAGIIARPIPMKRELKARAPGAGSGPCQ